MKVTINDVAEEAGVSKSTVSRYITQEGYVSSQSEKKIKTAIEKLNFIPNASARILKTKTNHLIGLLLPDISNPFFPELAKGVDEYLHQKGFRVMLGNISNDSKIQEEYLRDLLQNNAAGIIATENLIEKFPNLKLPLVVVDRGFGTSQYAVLSDDKEGGRIASEQIIASGGKNILLIKGLGKDENIISRFTESKKILKKYNKVIYHEFQSTSYDLEELQQESKHLLEKYKEIDSIIAPTDVHAIALIHEIQSLGKKIPDDIQIIGYDDIKISRLTYPSLSTIHQSSYEMGREAARMIYKISQNKKIENKKIILPVHYVERQTLRRIKNE
ncbi:Ribose operon repressor [Pseudolactococcus piscium]|nr:Ribose operon repressor [Lactococcus piscium]